MTKKANQVVIKDAFDRLAFEGISHASALANPIQADSDAVIDTFASFYKTNVETQGDGLRKQVIDQMLSLPEYQSLHEATQLDDVASALAATDFSKTLIQQIQSVEQQQSDREEPAEDLNGLLGEKGVGALRATLRRSLEQAEQKAEEWGDIKAGWGIEKGELSELSGPDRMALAERLMSSTKVKRVASLIGRFKNLVNAASTTVYSHGNDEIIDITMGNDLHRLLPSELVKLKSRPLEFYRAYLEGSLLQYNLKGQEPMGKGPIIVALDISASMSDRSGWAEGYARALTMALVHLATKEKRAFSVIFFDTTVQDVRTWEKGSKVGLKDRLALVNRESDGNGTNFVPPLAKTLELRSNLNPELKPADLVFITDGECKLPEDFEAEFNFARKQTDLRVYGFAIGSPATMTFCDSVYQITDEGQIDEVKDMIRKAATRK